MMRTIHPVVKVILELGPVVGFFIAFGLLKDQSFVVAGRPYSGFIAVTAGFVVLTMITSGLLWAWTGKLSKMQMMTLVLVVVMGGLSVWLNDPRFIKMKPTLLYGFFATALGIGLWRGTSYLQGLFDGALQMQDAGWMILTRRMAWFFCALALANEAVWRLMSDGAWVAFKTFGLTIALFMFIMAQGGVIEKYALPDKPKA